MRIVGAYLTAVLGTFFLGAVFATQAILSEVAGFGVEVGFGDRVTATLHDLAGLSMTYLPLIAIAFLIGLSVAAGIIRFALPQLRTFGYILGGAVAILAMHVIMKSVLGISGIAATRFLGGLIMQGVAGAIGGWLFVLVLGPKPASEA